jgi:hypothetical protein
MSLTTRMVPRRRRAPACPDDATDRPWAEERAALLPLSARAAGGLLTVFKYVFHIVALYHSLCATF